MITRNNYEEFFLLYVDNELSPADKQAVEEFVAANPDLQDEWDLTLQCRIAPDHLTSFGDIQSLLQPAVSEEELLSYVDNELDPLSRAVVSEWLSRHPGEQTSMDWLQKTISIPDTSIVFPDKESLYRHERRKVIALPWLRLSAAAITVGAIVLLIFKTAGNHNANTIAPGSADGQTAAAGHREKNMTPAVTPDASHPLHISKDGTTPADSKSPAQLAQTGSRPSTGTNRTSLTVPADKTVTTDRTVTANKDLAQKDPVLKNDPTPQRDMQSTLPLTATIDQPATGPAPDKIIAVVKNNNTANPDPGSARDNGPDKKNSSFATQALLAEAGTGDQGDGAEDEQASPKKNKLRGFFRKMSRVIEKRTNRDDDENHKVYFGGFALK